jgi:hypothetical protein
MSEDGGLLPGMLATAAHTRFGIYDTFTGVTREYPFTRAGLAAARRHLDLIEERPGDNSITDDLGELFFGGLQAFPQSRTRWWQP